MIRKGLITLLFTIFFTLIAPNPTFAHVKWFTGVTPERESIESVLSPLFFIMVIFTAVCLGALIFIMHKIDDADKLKRLHRYSFTTNFTNYFLQYGLAFALLIQIINGAILAPEFHVHDTYPYFLMIFIIVLLIIPEIKFVKVGSILLLYIYIEFIIRFGLFHLIDYIFYIGIIGFFLLLHTRWDRYKFPILIMTLGFSLCWLSAEKLIYPEMTINIIETYGVPTFGFDPKAFTKMAAFVEFAIGVSWMMCLYNRFFAIIFTVVSTLTTLLFGYMELVGHFLIIIMMLIFIAQNDSFKSLPQIVCRTLRGQIVFIGSNFIFIVFSIILVYYRFA